MDLIRWVRIFFAVVRQSEHCISFMCFVTYLKDNENCFATPSILNSSETPRTVYYAEFLQLWLTTLHVILCVVVKKDENYYFSRHIHWI